jgi:hypothetical protein
MRYRPGRQLGNLARASADRIFVPYDILDGGGRAIGSVAQKREKTGFLCWDHCYELLLQNDAFHLYGIGMGAEGYKFPLFHGKDQIALIEKGCVVRNKLDEYVIHALDDAANLCALFLALYIDVLIFGNRGEVVVKSMQKNYSVTKDTELLKRYDKTFARRTDD